MSSRGPNCSARFTALALVTMLAFCGAPGLAAAPARERDVSEADHLYHELGNSMFCLCGCRERLLSCSMVNCSFKETAQRYLREQCRDADLTPDQVRAKMIERFGPGIVQVQSDSLLYPVLFATGFGILGLFALGLWFVSARGKAAAGEAREAGGQGGLPELEARITRELDEME
ncbi:hypothetical protein EDM80_09040 [bacterium]|nr:MAG: hypothetical protein EDM80_09040 [bacterium]RIK61538.1 MAG: hypothetical protein DCC64_13130 [Planctomycetota bacterium]